jgi:hypothetical protein
MDENKTDRTDSAAGSDDNAEGARCRSVIDYESEEALRQAIADNGNPDWRLSQLDPATTQVQSMREELARLQILKSYLILDSEREDAFERITALASGIFNVQIALVSLVDLGRQWFMSNRGKETRTTKTQLVSDYGIAIHTHTQHRLSFDFSWIAYIYIFVYIYRTWRCQRNTYVTFTAGELVYGIHMDAWMFTITYTHHPCCLVSFLSPKISVLRTFDPCQKQLAHRPGCFAGFSIQG